MQHLTLLRHRCCHYFPSRVSTNIRLAFPSYRHLARDRLRGYRQLRNMSASKRKAPATPNGKSKRAKVEIPDYCETTCVRDENGEIIWPAPKENMDNARDIIRRCVQDQKETVICPDKDSDGLTSGATLHRTLTLMGLPIDKIHVHLLQKGANVHDDAERSAIAALQPAYVFVLDHGSRSSPPLLPYPHTALVIDHHFVSSPSDFPQGADHVSACASPPVATTSLLTFEICKPLHADVEAQCAWLAAVGTHGDLGSSLKWTPPFPDMAATFSAHTKKAINDASSLLNAPRRTAAYSVIDAWTALLAAVDGGPKAILHDPRLLAARAEVNAEVAQAKRAAPKFSRDGRVAVVRISSKAQVHPVIATRWARALNARRLEVVMAANDGYMEGKVHFSCRVASGSGSSADVIAVLKGIAAEHESGDLVRRLGESFARGHVQASGGIVGREEFEELMGVLRVGEKPDKEEGKSPAKAKGLGTQKNTLSNYFMKK